MEQSEKVIYVNGKFVKESEASISSSNRGFLYGDGLFETVRSYRGQLFALDDHFCRLKESSSFLKIKLPFDLSQLRELLLELLKKNGLEQKDGRVRINIARGEGRRGLFADEDAQSEVLAVVEEVPESIGLIQNNGIKLVIIRDIHIDSRSSLSSHKTFNYIPGVLGLMQVEARGGDEGVFLNYEGQVVEGVTSNIFMVKDSKVFTPPLSTGLLPGITRKKVIEVAQKERIEIYESDISEEELFGADEIFITSSVREIVPVISLDDKKYQIGATTRSIQMLYNRHVKEFF